MFERLLEDLGFQRLLTEQPLQLAHLALQSPIIRGRHDLFAAAGSRQRPLHHQPAPREQLVRGNAMSASHQAYRHARLKGLFDDPNLLSRCPAPTALNLVMISTRSVGLLIDTVVCLTLAKGETVSRRFGGYITIRDSTFFHRRLG